MYWGFHYTYLTRGHLTSSSKMRRRRKKKSLFWKHKLWRHIFSLIQGHTHKKRKRNLSLNKFHRVIDTSKYAMHCVVCRNWILDFCGWLHKYDTSIVYRFSSLSVFWIIYFMVFSFPPKYTMGTIQLSWINHSWMDLEFYLNSGVFWPLSDFLIW